MVKKKAEVIDLCSLDVTKGSNEGAEIELKHPVTNAPIGVFITVVGTDSDIYQKNATTNRNKRLQALTNRKKLDMSAEDLDAEGMDMLVSCTTGCRNLVDNGVEVKYSPSAIREIYIKYAWIKDQVDVQIADRSNFLP